MLVTFYSKSYENTVYFGDVAKQLIILMGHSATIPGAIKSEDLPEALSHLNGAFAKKQNYSSEEKNDEEPVEIALSKRAIPLINLLEYSIKNDSDILWDYTK